jgi:pantothenate kinase
MTDSTEPRGFFELLADARLLSEAGRRRILGITGPPGAGKSTLAQRLVTALGPERAVLVGMDGFHIADAELRRTGLRARKGAPDTFDRAGYASLLDRLRREPGTVYAPLFDRSIEDSIAAAVAVPAAAPLVVTEGNYLLLWPEIRPLLDQIWYLDPPDDTRRAALIARHVAFGKTEAEAETWVRASDDPNAEAIAAGRERADRVLGWTAD